jgi:hypothetical protein
LGRAIRLDEQIYTVIGVLPPGLSFPTDKELFVPLALSAQSLTNYDGYFLKADRALEAGCDPPASRCRTGDDYQAT